jgi:hypothetical protein
VLQRNSPDVDHHNSAPTASPPHRKRGLIQLVGLYALAVVASIVFHRVPNPARAWGLNLNHGVAVALVAAIASARLGLVPKFRLFGTNRYTAVISVVAIVLFIGLYASKGFVVVALSLTYTMMEESLWRFVGVEGLERLGFSFLRIVAITGPLWFLWHFSFAEENARKHPVWFALLLIAGTFGMVRAYQLTRSVTLVAAMHAAINLPQQKVILFFGVTVAMLVTYETYTKRKLYPE